MYLGQFAEEDQLTISDMKNAEKYLIKVLQPQSLCTSFDELRFEMYLARKISYIGLPPSSHSLQGHIQRCYYVIKQGISLLKDIPYMDPSDFGWSDNHGYFLPEKQLLPLPAYILIRCGCKTKCSGRCSCVKNGTTCTEFCKCKANC